MYMLCHYILEECNLFYDFTVGYNKETALVSEETLDSVVTERLWELLELD